MAGSFARRFAKRVASVAADRNESELRDQIAEIRRLLAFQVETELRPRMPRPEGVRRC
jgi:hypothetical protein